MIKLIVFDLDGVLIDSRNIHYHALNEALGSIDQKYVIDYEEHLAKYDGLNTTAKLTKLSAEKGLPCEMHDTVWRRKQDMTSGMFKRHLKPETHILDMLRELKRHGYTLYCASNSIWATIRDALYYTGYIQYFDWFVSNQDVSFPKPSSGIYLECLKRANVRYNECLICEDSPIGLTAARGSGAHVCQILNVSDLTISKIKWYISRIEENMYKGILSPVLNMESKRAVNVVIPMAGHGSRFSAAGYADPKPMIPVEGKPMIQRVIENIGIHNGSFIFIVQKSHDEKYKLREYLEGLVPGCKIVHVNEVTQGAACSVLLAEAHIDNDDPLLIANSDQLIEWGQGSAQADPFLYMSASPDVDGSISVFRSTDPKFSFAKTDVESGWVTEVIEKKVISDMATTGVYYWSRGRDYCTYAKRMIAADKRVNGEFYVAPVYNEAIEDGKKIRIVWCDKMHCLGTPEELAKYLAR